MMCFLIYWYSSVPVWCPRLHNRIHFVNLVRIPVLIFQKYFLNKWNKKKYLNKNNYLMGFLEKIINYIPFKLLENDLQKLCAWKKNDDRLGNWGGGSIWSSWIPISHYSLVNVVEIVPDQKAPDQPIPAEPDSDHSDLFRLSTTVLWAQWPSADRPRCPRGGHFPRNFFGRSGSTWIHVQFAEGNGQSEDNFKSFVGAVKISKMTNKIKNFGPNMGTNDWFKRLFSREYFPMFDGQISSFL